MRSPNLVDIESQFKDFFSSIDHPISKPIVFDTANWQRIDCPFAPKGNMNVSYKAHSDGRPCLKIQCHKCHPEKAIIYKFNSDSYVEITPQQRQAMRVESEKKKAEQAKKREAALIAMRTEWANAPPCVKHAYFDRKGLSVIETDGLRLDKHGQILCPVRLITGELTTTQSIPFKGRKKFYFRLSPENGFHIFNIIEAHDTIFFGEGIATCLTIRKAVQKPVICVYGKRFSKIAPIIEKAYPDKKLIYCCDLPSKDEKVTSEDNAKKAIALVGGFIVLPDFSMIPETLAPEIMRSDFNDLYCLLLKQGKTHGDAFDEIRRQILNLKDTNMISGKQETISEKQPLNEEIVGQEKLTTHFKILSFEDMLNAKSMAWRIYGIFPAQGIGTVFGQSGTGKTFLVISFIMAIANGDSHWFGHRIIPSKITYICLEGEEGFKNRIKAWHEHNKKKSENIQFITQAFHLLDNTQIEKLAKDIIQTQGKGGVVIIDTLSRAAPGKDENGPKDMSEIIASVGKLQNLIEGLVILVHHSGKDETRGPRGHTALPAALDGAIEVKALAKHRKWKIYKSKDGETGKDHSFKLDVVHLGKDSYGEPITSCIVTPDINAPITNTKPKIRGKHQQLAMSVLESLIRASDIFPEVAGGKAGVTYGVAEKAIAEQLVSVDKPHRKLRVGDAIQGLITLGYVCVSDDWLWLED